MVICTNSGVTITNCSNILIASDGKTYTLSGQMSEYLDRMLAKREKVVIAAESGRKIAALAAMYASERGYSFIPVANDDLSTYLAKQQQKGCVMFDGAENEREIENTCRKLRIPLRRCKLEGA